MQKRTAWKWICVTLSLIGGSAHASRFANQFVEFELPANWQCNLEGAEWVCQSSEDSKKRDAIIILAAKLRGEHDTLDSYLAHLKEAKSYNSVKGKPVRSEPKYAKMVNINEHPWVDSLHLESEIPGFYTRYIATIKSDIGILVTYSINKDKYQQYLSEFENMVKTLKAFRKTGGLNAAPSSGSIFQATNIPKRLSETTVFPSGTDSAPLEEKAPIKTSSTSPGIDDTTFVLIVVGVVVAYIIWRRRRGGM